MKSLPSSWAKICKSNTFQLQYDFTRRLSARIGYFFMDRTISQFSATWDTGEIYFPGGAGATAATDYFAARGDCALVGGALPSACIKERGRVDYRRFSDKSGPGSRE